MTFITDNPAIVTSLIAAVLAVGAAFGLNLTQAQSEAILALAGAILALGVVAHKTTVPKTPSTYAKPKSFQR